MYLVINLLIFTAGLVILGLGTRAKRRSTQVIGSLIVLGALFFYALVDFWVDVRWFNALGYEPRFWREIVIKVLTGASAAVFSALVVLILNLSNKKSVFKWPGVGAAFILGAVWGVASWETVLAFLNRISTGMTDPIAALGMDTGFYLFTFPFLDALLGLLVMTAIVSAAVVAGSYFIKKGLPGAGPERLGFGVPGEEEGRFHPAVYLTCSYVMLILAFGRYLDRFRLMFSELGIVTGPGWTDVNIRIPAYNLMVVVLVLAAVAVFLPVLRPFRNILSGRADSMKKRLVYLGGVAGVTGVIWLFSLGIVPGLFQALRVEPNEITFEKPYIKNNIDFTQRGFDLYDAEVLDFPVSEKMFTQKTVDENRALFNNIRLWDWRALDAVYSQFQEIRLYYEFNDVDIDRYRYNGDYRQVMVSAREIVPGNLPRENQTFVNRRFKYTHGYGITMTAVNEFTPEGLPDLLVKDIPPVSRFDELEVKRPEIYYGELTDSYVVANSSEKEFDYPRGDANIYVHYQGTGGVKLRGLWDKFLMGWKFGGTRFFLSGYPRKGSRLMFYRKIKDRVRKLAPFLYFERDPYIVLSGGKLYWILDAYTASGSFPYSEPFFSGVGRKFPGITGQQDDRASVYLSGINYLRNSVKIVVDAYNGEVDMYIFDEKDPIIQVWDRIFPKLFRKKEELSPDLRRHIRYPAGMLLTQGLVYAKYHMTDPEVFYNQEDLWVRATEKYYNRVRDVEPYYIMWEPPGSGDIEFTLILPFTPKNKQVMIGWIAGMCDGENYGKLIAYKFPKDKRVLGTQQVETKIDQDRELSGKLTLWDQRGSSVIRGNVLAIPIEERMLYVEPIYLQAETSAYPELRLVVLMQDDRLSYGESFSEALKKLIGQAEVQPPDADKKEMITLETTAELSAEADKAFNDYLEYMGRKDFRSASEALERLRSSLKKIRRKTKDVRPQAE